MYGNTLILNGSLILNGATFTYQSGFFCINGIPFTGNGGGGVSNVFSSAYNLPSGQSSIFVPLSGYFAVPNVNGTLRSNNMPFIFGTAISGVSTSGFFVNCTTSVPNSSYYYDYIVI